MALQTLGVLTRQRPFLERQRRRYGNMFSIKVASIGHLVILADPALIKHTFQADAKTLHAGSRSPLRKVLGDNSLLGIDEEHHMEQRKLLLPPFKGQRMKAYEPLIEEIAIAEIDRWPVGVEFETAKSMQRITLRAILRAVFGATGARAEELEELLPDVDRPGPEPVALPAAAPRPRAAEPVGPLPAPAREGRRDPRLADRGRAPRPRPARAPRRPGDDGARAPRGRQRALQRRDPRPARHDARRRPRDDGAHAQLGGRAAAAPPGRRWRGWSRRSTPAARSCARRRSARSSACVR